MANERQSGREEGPGLSALGKGLVLGAAAVGGYLAAKYIGQRLTRLPQRSVLDLTDVGIPREEELFNGSLVKSAVSRSLTELMEERATVPFGHFDGFNRWPGAVALLSVDVDIYSRAKQELGLVNTSTVDALRYEAKDGWSDAVPISGGLHALSMPIRASEPGRQIMTAALVPDALGAERAVLGLQTSRGYVGLSTHVEVLDPQSFQQGDYAGVPLISQAGMGA